MTDEMLGKRRINDDPVTLPPALVPARSVLTGSTVQLEPIDPGRHTSALFRAGNSTEAARDSWAFLPWGPFQNEAAMHAQLRDFAAALDRVFYAICDRATGGAVGIATYLDIQPASGVIEIGGIWFAPKFARSRGATEALFLMLAYAMDDLGYRRMQWRCNALNEKKPRSRPTPGLPVRGHLVQQHDCQRTEPRYRVVLEWRDVIDPKC